MKRAGAPRFDIRTLAAAALLLAPFAIRGSELPADVLAAQRAEYDATAPKSIIELQPFRRTVSVQVDAPQGPPITATLIELNPAINAWFVLTLRRSGEDAVRAYHIENPKPQTQTVTLDANYAAGIRIYAEGRSFDCALWPDGQPAVLERARRSLLPDTSICEDRLYLRNTVAGTYTNLERITNVLRDHVWGGEKIVGFIRNDLFRDAFIERASPGAPAPAAADAPAQAGPGPAALSAGFGMRSVRPDHLAIDLGPDTENLVLGRWYPVRDGPGMYVSVMEPDAVATTILDSYREYVGTLDSVEGGALDYLVALDLSQFEVGFELGTDHPRVGWSERSLASVRDPRLPGPDGIGSEAPLVLNGMVSPILVARTAAAFAGGFKREHGAFRSGPLAEQNAGSHYGFIEQGAVFSKLQPGLATLLVTDTGAVQMKTWTRADDAQLEHIKHARQNGVPLIEYDAASGISKPGLLVSRWGPGNWSGSTEERFRTLRAGACLQETGSTRYLIFGYFSTATPAAMARVFQAYGCRYAMHLDMNALEHTYFAVYTRKNGQIAVQHLVEGMAEVDRKGGNQLAPRFLGFPDDRDFFYFTKKEHPP